MACWGALTPALSRWERERSVGRWLHISISRSGFQIQSGALSARIFLYASRATSKAFLAASFSEARIAGSFLVQHWSTDLRHHSADFFDARMGLPPTVT